MDFEKDNQLEELLRQLANCYVVHNTLFGLDDIHDLHDIHKKLLQTIEDRIGGLINQKSKEGYRNRFRWVKGFYEGGGIIDALDVEEYVNAKPKGIRGLSLLDRSDNK